MPNRLVRDGFVDSESVNALSDWAHRVYSNLLIRCDDAGRFDGRLEVIRSQLFPLGTSRRVEDFKKAIAEMASPVGANKERLPALVVQYDHAGKPFLQLTKVMRCSPAITSKFPWKDGGHRIVYVKRSTRDGEKEFVETSLNDGVRKGSATHADPSDHVSNESTETKTEAKAQTKAGDRAEDVPIPASLKTPKFVAKWHEWLEYRKSVKKAVSVTAAKKQLGKFDGWGIDDAIGSIDQSIENDWQGLFRPKAGKSTKASDAEDVPSSHDYEISPEQLAALGEP